jgi:hypothetical protein
MTEQVPETSDSNSVRPFLNIWDFIHIHLRRRTLQYAGVFLFRSPGRTTSLLSVYNLKVISPEKLLHLPKGEGEEEEEAILVVRDEASVTSA